MTMEVTGFRIGDFAYITDTNYIPGNILAQLLDCKIIVLNALRKKKHLSHYNLEEAVNVLKFLHPEKAYITHISHLMGFHKEVNTELPDFIELAYDGMEINI
jgi:phosphoribosyl 1,2-cyclic phosphate phosphodiesterase